MTKNKNKYMNKKPRVFLHYYIICFKLYVKNFFLKCGFSSLEDMIWF